MIIKSKINLKLTQESGQTSQPPWIMEGNDYCELVFIENIPVLLKVGENNGFLDMEYDFMDNKNDLDFIIDKASFKNNVLSEAKYLFDLDFDLDKFYKYLEEDALKPSIDFCNGLRLFKARDPFECIISSICSANNSIARWTNSISEIRRLWGKKYTFSKVSKGSKDSGDFYTFPSINSFKNIHEDELAEVESSGKTAEECNFNLKSCGVGYRAPYMKKTAEILSETSINEIKTMNYDEAFETVLALPGVGPKVADCILFYGFGFGEAFPSDVWIKRIISHLYFNDKDITTNKARDFGMNKFGKYAGYVQLYLFHYARKSGLLAKLNKK